MGRIIRASLSPRAWLLRTLVVLGACVPVPTEPLVEEAGDTATESAEQLVATSDTILIDASHDGGVWWFPQGVTYDQNQPHQGKALADYIRSKGFAVRELGRGVEITEALLARYRLVLRAGAYSPYSLTELAAYGRFVEREDARLVLLPHFIRDGQYDLVSDRLGLAVGGLHRGTMTPAGSHALTRGVGPLGFGPGSAIDPSSSATITPVGRLGDGRLVMATVDDKPAKILFLGDLLLIERVPQPLVDNLLVWLTS